MREHYRFRCEAMRANRRICKDPSLICRTNIIMCILDVYTSAMEVAHGHGTSIPIREQSGRPAA